MDKSLVQKLKWCRRELAALKIAHEQSLEGVSFFTATASKQITIGQLFDRVNVYVNYDENIINEPFCQVYLDNPQFFQKSLLFYISNQHDLYLDPYWVGSFTTTINVKVISSAEIKSIEIVKEGVQ